MGAWAHGGTGARGHGRIGAWGTRNGLFRDAGVPPAIPKSLLTQMNARHRQGCGGQADAMDDGRGEFSQF
jgi:hypothetical protein